MYTVPCWNFAGHYRGDKFFSMSKMFYWDICCINWINIMFAVPPWKIFFYHRCHIVYVML